MPVYIPAWITASINAVYATRDAQANVFSFAAGGPNPSVAELNDLADTLSDWVNNHYKGLVGPAVNFVNIHVRDASSDVGEVVDRSLNYTGTALNETLPANVTACVSLRTAHGGRSGRGRFFALTTTESNVLAGVWVQSYVDGLLAATNELISATTLLGIPLVIASRKHLELWAVETAIVRAYTCSQTDRLPFHHRRRRRLTP